jgi:hypothetical protein
MRIIKLVSSLFAAAILVGCAHPIMMTPDVAKIERDAASPPIRKDVAYFIADDLRSREVTTPGGGGDKVSYVPYRDIETGFYKMLTNVFGSVTKLKSPTDMEAIRKNNVAYVITPTVVTNSSSPSPFTWPPTQFYVELTCDITDANGNKVLSQKVMGEGRAEFDEFKSDFSLSAKRGSQDALLKMQRVLLEAPALRK